MNKILSYVLILAFSFFIVNNLKAQHSGVQMLRRQADSVQRRMIKDSFGIRDSIIDKLYQIRDSMFAKTDEIRSDNALSFDQQNKLVAIVRTKVNERIRELMGAQVFAKYIKMIGKRLIAQHRSGLPLAGYSGD
ncbi:MAG TPA: hypothetical protein VNS32_10835 [Flavisolibacter sp.]|nr:hypothetical protein [Flavisolibacter sp.]